MSPRPTNLRERLQWARDDLHEQMQRIYFRYNIDIPNVLTSLLSVSMICVALGFVFIVRGG
jgi:hypothetical protein